MQGFSAIAVPIHSQDLLLAFNDIGVGYFVYRDRELRLVTAVAPTFEVHVNTPLNHLQPKLMYLSGQGGQRGRSDLRRQCRSVQPRLPLVRCGPACLDTPAVRLRGPLPVERTPRPFGAGGVPLPHRARCEAREWGQSEAAAFSRFAASRALESIKRPPARRSSWKSSRPRRRS